MTHYAASSADLLAVFAPHESLLTTWPKYVNAKFEAFVRPGAPVHKWEHVERCRHHRHCAAPPLRRRRRC